METMHSPTSGRPKICNPSPPLMVLQHPPRHPHRRPAQPHHPPIARLLSNHFQFPASSIIVFSFLSTAAAVVLIDSCLRPMWKRAAANNPTPLQLIVASMAVSALVGSRRRRSVMSVMWLVPQMVIVGIGEAFHFPGQVGLYYQEFPDCLKSLATAMVAMLVGVAFYLSTAVVDFITRITDWLPDNIDHGRVHYLYWVMVVIGVINFGYFLLISWLYEYNNGDVVVGKDGFVSTDEA